jgi:N-acetylmuramoyl-L-alanine amidase
MKIKKSLCIILVAIIVSLQPALVVAEDNILEQNLLKEAIPVQNLAKEAQEEALTWIGTVKLPSGNLNIRKGPSLEDEIIGKLANGSKVEVLEQSAEWATISYNGSNAYISIQYLNVVKTKVDTKQVDDKIDIVDPVQGSKDQTSTEDLIWIGTVKLESGNLNVRKGPSTKEEIIGKLPSQSKVEVLEQSAEWATISHNGTTGYVSLEYLNVAKTKVDTKINTNLGYKKVIVLDPGHGGKDPGAIVKGSIYESKLVWQYASKAKEALENSGYIVYLTRTEKNSCTSYKQVHDELDCRISLVEKVKGDIYISLHADANPSSKFRGTVTFYNDRNDLDGNINPFAKESKRLAQFVQSKVQPVIGSKDRGVTNQNYYVNRMNTVPSVLVELGVMTNAADLKILNNKNNIDKVSLALVKAVDQYFGF